MDALFQPVANLKGIGTKRAEALEKLGIRTPYDLLYHVPRGYLDYSHPVPVAAAPTGEPCVIRVQIVHKLAPQFIRKGMTIFKAVATDGLNDVTVILYNNPYGFQALHTGSWYRMSGKLQGGLLRREISAPHVLADDSKELIYPSYPLTSGITMPILVRAVKQAIELMRQQPFDWMPEEMRLEHGLLPLTAALEQVHFPANPALMETARRRLAFDELLQLQLGMLIRRADNRRRSAYPMRQDTDLEPFYGALPFTMTAGQKHAVEEITADLCGDAPMNRLLQGDVGSGKTAVAAAACYFAARNGMQCALMAPTEILAVQHYHTMQQFLEPLGVSVGLLTGSVRAKERREIYEALADGSMTLVVGTHAIFQKEVSFARLGLVITDEQHRFGVRQRGMLAEKAANPHLLVMSATPIPRTLGLLIYGDLDISILDELPPGRTPVKTRCITGKRRQDLYRFLDSEIDKGRQVYLVCPAIEDVPDGGLNAVKTYYEDIAKALLPDRRVGLMHGKLKPKEKAAVMEDFKAGRLDALVSTTVIEVGVDVPNASVMVIENAERYGLSALHQLRGRVGRGAAESWCFLVSDNTSEAVQKRLKFLCSTTDGFAVAQYDLETRGPGDFFGSRQHGLPTLQIADLMNDTRTLHAAQSEAAALLAADPLLESPAHALLAAQVQQMFDKAGPMN